VPAAALLLALLTPAANTAPADCAAQSDAINRVICADPALASEEAQMQELYAGALKLSPPQRTAQQARQAAWLRERAGCASDPQTHACVAAQLDRRIVELKIVLAQTQAFATVTYLCEGEDPIPVHAAYYRSDPPAVRLTFSDHDLVAFVAPSASGARYTGEGVEIWEHQGIARLRWAGVERTCPKQ
jgi:uncharacterized protein